MAGPAKAATRRVAALASIAIVRALGFLPLPLARWTARRVFGAVLAVIPRVRSVGLANLDLAYGDSLSRKQKLAILHGAIDNVAVVAAEFWRTRQISAPFLTRHVDVRGLEHLPPNGGCILFGGHIGNWEWMAPTMQALGYPMAEVVRPLDDALLSRFVDGIRSAGGVVTIPKTHAGAEAMRLLKDGFIVGILVDQSPRFNAAPAKFFGRPCWATIGVPILAVRANVPIFPLSMVRGTGDRYTVEIHPEVELLRDGPTHQNIVENTQRCQAAVEAIVRDHPEQWLWFHRRWKTRKRLEDEWAARNRAREARRETGERPAIEATAGEKV